MTKVCVVTDSTADIPKDLVKSLGITVVPLKVHIQNNSYLDGETLTPTRFYELLEESEEMPTTSQPSPADFVQTYKELYYQGYSKIISIHLSSALSGTLQSAQLAKTMVEEEGIEVAVIDSRKASYSIGLGVVGVAEAVKDGLSFEDAIQLANELITKTQVYFMVDSLIHLHKGGRIGKAASLFGSILNIKPILSLNDQGEVYAKEKARGKNKAFSKISQYFIEYANGKSVRVGISHANNLEDAKKYEEKIKANMEIENLVITDIGPVIGTHVGAGTVAIMMYTVD